MGFAESRMQDNARLQNSISSLGQALSGTSPAIQNMQLNRQRSALMSEQVNQLQRKNQIENNIRSAFQDAIVVDPKTGVPVLDMNKAGNIMGLLKQSDPNASLDDLTKMMQTGAMEAWKLKSEIIKKGLDPVAQGSMRAPITSDMADAIMGGGQVPQGAATTNMAPIDANNASRERIAAGNNQTQQNIATQGDVARQTLQDTKPQIVPQGSMMVPGRGGQGAPAASLGAVINKKMLPNDAMKDIVNAQSGLVNLDQMQELIQKHPETFSLSNRLRTIMPDWSQDLIGTDQGVRDTWSKMNELSTKIGHDIGGVAGARGAGGFNDVINSFKPNSRLNKDAALHRIDEYRDTLLQPLGQIKQVYGSDYQLPENLVTKENFQPGMFLKDNPRTETASAPAAQSAPVQLGPLDEARDAIRRGAPRDAVVQRLQQMKIDPSGL